MAKIDLQSALSRRRFLELSAASAAGLAAACGGRSGGGGGASADYDAIVVGAGIGGLGAGHMLRTLGLRSVVLEARDRIGGRCYCDNSFPAPFDFGGQFFHQVVPNELGGTNNPLYDLFRSQGGPDVPCDLRPTFYQGGVRSPQAEQDAFLEMAVAVAAEVSAAGLAAELGGPDMSAADATADLVGQPWYTLTTAFMELALDAHPTRLSCHDAWNDLKLAVNLDGSTSDRVNPGGMGNWILQFADGLDIRLSTQVADIDTTAASRIEVVTERGSLTAKAVIVAVPVTVLAAERIRFTPALPDRYVAAVHDLPFGLVDKIGLAFGSNVFGDTPDNLVVTRHLDTSRFGMGLARLAGTPMMNLIVGGDLAVELEAGGVPAFRAYAEEFLTATYDASVAAAIDRLVVHPWGTDEWTMGSYSAALPGKASARTTLATPIDDRVFFAGEAVSSTAHSSLHGAYVT